MTLKAPGQQAGVVAAFTYLGMTSADPLGRRLVTKSFPNPVPASQVGSALGRVTTEYFDEIGRIRRNRG